MATIVSCDFCGKEIQGKPNTLGEAWKRYGKELPYKDACGSCWDKLSTAYDSWDEINAIRRRNIDEAFAAIKREKNQTKSKPKRRQ